jgi:hypothetical protein
MAKNAKLSSSLRGNQNAAGPRGGAGKSRTIVSNFDSYSHAVQYNIGGKQQFGLGKKHVLSPHISLYDKYGNKGLPSGAKVVEIFGIAKKRK